MQTYSQVVHPIRIIDKTKISAGHYPRARSVILWMLTLLLPGSWCFYYINNGAGTIHHTDMRPLIMSVRCIFPPFHQKRREAEEDRKWRNSSTDGKSCNERQEGNDGGKIVEGVRWKGTTSMCWTHDRCPWPFAEWPPCWQELTSVFKQEDEWDPDSLCSLNQPISIPTHSLRPRGNANMVSWHWQG